MKKLFLALFITVMTLGAGCSDDPAMSNTAVQKETKPVPTTSEPVMPEKPVVTPSTPSVPTPATSTTEPTSPAIEVVDPKKPVSTTPVQTVKSYTMAQVQAANTPAKCWTAINGDVYDVTAWAKKHPGGDTNIYKLCGIDGSSLFNKKHGGQPQPEKTLAGFEIGVLK